MQLPSLKFNQSNVSWLCILLRRLSEVTKIVIDHCMRLLLDCRFWQEAWRECTSNLNWIETVCSQKLWGYERSINVNRIVFMMVLVATLEEGVCDLFFASHERKDTLCLFLTHFLCLIVRPILHFSLIVTQTEVVDLICAHILLYC